MRWAKCSIDVQLSVRVLCTLPVRSTVPYPLPFLQAAMCRAAQGSCRFGRLCVEGTRGVGT